AGRVMTVARWVFGLSSLAFVIWLVAAAQTGRVDVLGAILIAMTVSVVGAVALSLLSPLVVPLVGGLLGLAVRRSTFGEIAQANLRDSVRRRASTAAPLTVPASLV